MGFMKNEDIRVLNDTYRFTTQELEAWVIHAEYAMGCDGEGNKGDDDKLHEIIDRLRELDELKARYVLLQKRHEDLYGRLTAFAENLGALSA